jgi:hypothetical protein
LVRHFPKKKFKEKNYLKKKYKFFKSVVAKLCYFFKISKNDFHLQNNWRCLQLYPQIASKKNLGDTLIFWSKNILCLLIIQVTEARRPCVEISPLVYKMFFFNFIFFLKTFFYYYISSSSSFRPIVRFVFLYKIFT